MAYRFALLCVSVTSVLAGCGMPPPPPSSTESPLPEAPTPTAPAGYRTSDTFTSFGYVYPADWEEEPGAGATSDPMYHPEQAPGQWRMMAESYNGCSDPDKPGKFASQPKGTDRFTTGTDPYQKQQYALQEPPRKLSVPDGVGWRYDLTGQKTGDDYVVLEIQSAHENVSCVGEKRLYLTIHDAPDTAGVIADHVTIAPPAETSG